ncbi:hypothetical protein D3C78_719100 [compost metagenome]
MPELRNNPAAFGMHGFDDVFPAGQGVFTMKTRHVGVTVGGLVADGGAFGDDQAHAAGGAATVVLDDLGMRHTTGAKSTSHWRHDHTAWQREGTQLDRGEQCGGGHAALQRSRNAPEDRVSLALGPVLLI